MGEDDSVALLVRPAAVPLLIHLVAVAVARIGIGLLKIIPPSAFLVGMPIHRVTTATTEESFWTIQPVARITPRGHAVPIRGRDR